MERLRVREVELEAFVHATESLGRVERALLQVAPGARVERQEVAGHFGQPLLILRARLRERAAVEEVLGRLAQAAGAQLAQTLARRVDDQGRLFARLDKQAAARGNIALSNDPENDVIKLTVRPRARPRGRAQALAAYQERLTGTGDGGAPQEEE